ncbi:MAG TPA: hypothetical protein VMW32_11910 [Bacteroidales bacterium]|nr:hypothetical protein [Bacteroidales bacterium]
MTTYLIPHTHPPFREMENGVPEIFSYLCREIQLRDFAQSSANHTPD